MPNPIRGTVYPSRSAVLREIRRDTLRRFSTIGTAILVVGGAALIAVLIHPPLLNWLWQ